MTFKLFFLVFLVIRYLFNWITTTAMQIETDNYFNDGHTIAVGCQKKNVLSENPFRVMTMTVERLCNSSIFLVSQ